MVFTLPSGSQSEGFTSGTSVLCDFPAHNVGDLLIVLAFSRDGAIDDVYTGWDTQRAIFTDPLRSRSVMVAWRVATSAAESLTVTRETPGSTNYYLGAFSYVFPAGSFDASDPVSAFFADSGTPDNVSIPAEYRTSADHVAGDANETVLLAIASGDDVVSRFFHLGDPQPWALDQTADSTSGGADVGMTVRPVTLGAGQTLTGAGWEYTGSEDRSAALFGIAIRGSSSARPLTDDFSVDGSPPVGGMWEGYERQDSTSWCVASGGELLLRSKDPADGSPARMSAAIRHPWHAADVDIAFDLRIHELGVGRRWICVWPRAVGASYRPPENYFPEDGIGVRLNSYRLEVLSSSGGVVSSHGLAVDPGLSGLGVEVVAGVRVRVTGSGRVRARVWNKAGAEPEDWDVDEVVAGAPASGFPVILDYYNEPSGFPVGNVDWFVDNVQMTLNPADGARWLVREAGVWLARDTDVRDLGVWLETLTHTRDASLWTPGVV